MSKSFFTKQLRIITLIISLFSLTACIGGTKEEITRYFLIDPAITASITDMSDTSLEIRDLQIPQYLQRFQIVSRSAENRLRLSEFNQWGENLRENLIRTLGRNLSAALNTNNITTPLNRGNTKAELRIQLHIEQFEYDIDKKVKLVARWEIVSASAKKTLGVYSFEASSTNDIEEDDYDVIVQSMQDLYADMSLAIAQSIIKHTDS